MTLEQLPALQTGDGDEHAGLFAHCPSLPHVCGPFPLHRFSPGLQTPHTPVPLHTPPLPHAVPADAGVVPHVPLPHVAA
jgi:hypothetical protein